MDKAATEEKQRRAAEASRKRPPSTTPMPEPPDTKRAKLEDGIATPSSASFLSSFDFTTLPSSLVTDLIVANLQAFSETALTNLVQSYLEKRSSAAASSAIDVPESTPEPSSTRTPSATPVPAPPTAPAKSTTPPTEPPPTAGPSRSKSPPGEPATIKEEPVDPLQMDIDQDDIDYEPDRINIEVR